MTTPPLNTPAKTLPVDPGKFVGDSNLKYNGAVVEYYGKRYHVYVTDENGASTRLSDPDKIKRIVRMLAQANFHANKQDLANTTISESKVKVSGKPVDVFNADKVNRLFLKVFDQIKQKNQKKEDFTIEFRDDATSKPVDQLQKEALEIEKIAALKKQALDAQKKVFFEKRLMAFKDVASEFNDPIFEKLRNGTIKAEEVVKLEEALKNKKTDVASYERNLPNNVSEDTKESRELRHLIVDAKHRLEDIDQLIVKTKKA